MQKTIKIIESKDNTQIKKMRKLAQKKFRQKYGQFLVENAVIIKDALSFGRDPEAIIVTEEFCMAKPEMFETIKKKSEANIFIVSNEINKHYSTLDKPSGITAVFDMKKSPLEKDASCLYLNSINDPGNLGTIIRTMVAFGLNNLVVDEGCADIFNPKTVSAAKDAIFKINILKDKEMLYLKTLDDKTDLIVSDVADGTKLDDFSVANPYCLVMGSESHGVSDEIYDIPHEKIHIEMKQKNESLNVAIATAILLYNINK